MGNPDLSSIYNHPDIYSVSEYVNDKFYFAVLVHGKQEPQKSATINFFSIDDELVYNNFYDDFGPLNLGCLFKYCWKVNKKLNNYRNSRKKIVHYTTQDERKKANAAFLVTAYAILFLKKTPKDAYKPLIEGNNNSMLQFQDASMGISRYTIRLPDCLNALYKAVNFGLFNFDDFNLSEYEKYEKMEYGDLNWIVPQKFLAFIGPSTEPGSVYHPPEHYLDYFLQNEVTAVVRLNKAAYDPQRFTRVGIQHYDMYMPDGGVPPRKILNEFLQLAETTTGPIAVHCKAGLGRTGSLISAYLIKHYKMTAREAIAWSRICRPGSVIGHQQTWLEYIEKKLWYDGEQFRLARYGDINKIMHHDYGIYSVVNKLERKHNIVMMPNDYAIMKKRAKYMDPLIAKDHDEENATNDKNLEPGILSVLVKKFKSSEEKSSSQDDVTERSETQGDRLNKIKVKRYRQKTQ